MKTGFTEIYNDVFACQFNLRCDRCVVVYGVGTATMGIVDVIVVILLRRFDGDTIRIEDFGIARVNSNVMSQWKIKARVRLETRNRSTEKRQYFSRRRSICERAFFTASSRCRARREKSIRRDGRSMPYRADSWIDRRTRPEAIIAFSGIQPQFTA
jgi:hypothetical protein